MFTMNGVPTETPQDLFTKDLRVRAYVNTLHQCCPTRGKRTACGPPTDFMRPASAG